jgi:hypothetical protein
MTHKHSFLALTIALASTLSLGCASDASAGGAENALNATQAAQGSDEKKEGYGYEMMPLRLVSESAVPAGDALTADGRVAPEEILRQATARVGEIRTCYEALLQRDPEAHGQVVMNLSFEADGSMRSATVDSGSIGDGEARKCVMNVFRTITVPASSRGGLQVIYPVELAPEDLAKTAARGS